MTNTQRSNQPITRPEWLPRDTWPFEIRTHSIDGHPIAYTDEGRGPALVLVHDGLWSFVWSQLIDRLRGQFRVITLDFPGSGLSPDSGEPVSLQSDSTLLRQFVEDLELTSYTLVAHDLGGPVAIGAAARHPERVDGLVMANTFAWPAQKRPLKTMLAIMSSPPVAAVNDVTNLIAHLSSGRYGVGRNLPQSRRRAFLGPFHTKGPRRRFHKLMGSARVSDAYLADVERALQERFGDRPCLTIFGERNDPFGFQARFGELIPHAEAHVVAKGYHFPMCDAPDRFAAWLVEWHSSQVQRGARPDGSRLHGDHAT